jgi:hypothetical protein
MYGVTARMLFIGSTPPRLRIADSVVPWPDLAQRGESPRVWKTRPGRQGLVRRIFRWCSLFYLAGCGNTQCALKSHCDLRNDAGARTARRMLKMTGPLIRPTSAATPPARPKSAKTASSPRDTPFRGRGRLSACPAQAGSERRGESYSVSYIEPLSDARTKLADFSSILLERFGP